MDYDDYATRYRCNRFAVEWLLEPLLELVRELGATERVVEVGCGTGNYTLALLDRCPDPSYFGFDRSERMLEQAELRSTDRAGPSRPSWQIGNADAAFPYEDDFARLVFLIDVIHHLEHTDVLFRESARVLGPGGSLLIATDAPEDLRARSLTRYFPETLEIERRRYPDPSELDRQASAAGLRLKERRTVTGKLELSPDFVQKLEARCASSLRLLPDEAHRAGMARVRAASERSEIWHSQYTVYRYERD